MSVIGVQLQAMSVSLPEVPNHPNRMPFSGVLVLLDEPSDKSPEGASGRLIQVSKSSAEAALASLIGMSVDFTEDLSGHDPRRKIGVITGATVVGNSINIEGIFYPYDFPDETAYIKENKDLMGFSFEADLIRVEDPKANPLVVTSLVFTGAAVLRKDKAAYTKTSLAASATEDKMDKELKEFLDGMKASQDAATKAISDITAKVDKLEQGGLKANMGMIDRVAPHAAKLNADADDMAAAGIGLHATHGHVACMRAMASHMMKAAASGEMPHIFTDHSWQNDFRSAADDAKKLETQVAAAIEAATKPLLEKLASHEQTVKDLKAAADKKDDVTAPERKTLAPAVTHLLARAGLAPDEKTGKIKASAIDEALRKMDMDPVKRIELKRELEKADRLEVA